MFKEILLPGSPGDLQRGVGQCLHFADYLAYGKPAGKNCQNVYVIRHDGIRQGLPIAVFFETRQNSCDGIGSDRHDQRWIPFLRAKSNEIARVGKTGATLAKRGGPTGRHASFLYAKR